MAEAPPCLRPQWPAPPGVGALCTTRAGGVSPPPYASLNLALHVGDAPARVAANRRRLAALLGPGVEVAWLEHDPGATVRRARPGVTARGDGLWTDAPGLACAVLTADCLPVLLCDAAGSAVAALHAGWRGLAAGILQAGVAAMGRPPARLMAWLGPAIGPARYVVGPEVRAAFPGAKAAFAPAGDGRWHCDLYALARLALAAAGVEAVYGGGACTYDDRRFYSYRRDGVTGRMASLVWLEA